MAGIGAGIAVNPVSAISTLHYPL